MSQDPTSFKHFDLSAANGAISVSEELEGDGESCIYSGDVNNMKGTVSDSIAQVTATDTTRVLDESDRIAILIARAQEEQIAAITDPRFPKVRQLAAHTQREHLASLGARKIYYAQRAFTHPSEFREIHGRLSPVDEKKMLQFIVIHPGYIGEELLFGLGLATRVEWKVMRQEERIARKISHIPDIKKLLLEAQELTIFGGVKTGRILQLHTGKNAGKYLVFQEISTLDEERIGQRGPKKSRMVPHIYKDVFSLVRSQEHALESMSQEHNEIEFIVSMIDDLRMQWTMLDVAERGDKIAEISQKLHSHRSFGPQHAETQRLARIDHKNPTNDLLRLAGACRDLLKSNGERLSKQSNVIRQVSRLRAMINRHNSQFFLLYGSFFSTLSHIDQKELEEKASQIKEGKEAPDFQLSPQTHKKLGTLWSVARMYTEQLRESGTVGAPFNTFERSTRTRIDTLDYKNQHATVRHLLGLTLELKMQASKLFLYAVLDSIKSGRIENEKPRLIEKMNVVIHNMESVHFLGNIQIKGITQSRLVIAHERLVWLRDELSQDDNKSLAAKIQKFIAK